MWKFAFDSATVIWNPPLPPLGDTRGKRGGFTSFSLDLGSLVIEEYTFFHGFAINNAGTEKGLFHSWFATSFGRLGLSCMFTILPTCTPNDKSMMWCEGDERCTFKWFHYSCVGMVEENGFALVSIHQQKSVYHTLGTLRSDDGKLWRRLSLQNYVMCMRNSESVQGWMPWCSRPRPQRNVT